MADEDTEDQEPTSENEEGLDGEEGEDGESAGGFDAKKIILFVVLPLLILIGIGGGLYMSGMLDSMLGGSAEEHVEGEEGHGEEHAAAEDHGDDHGDGHGDGHGGGNSAFLEIPTMLVNLNSDDGTPRFLRLTVQLEMKKPSDVAAVEAVIPRVVDQFQTYLRELRVKDLRGSAGIYRLQTELLWRVNQAAAPVEVKDVLFQEILIQ